MKELYTTAEVAQRYGVTSQTIINYCNNGKISPNDFTIVQGKHSKTYRFFPSVFDRLNKNRNKDFISDAVKARNKSTKKRLQRLIS